MSPLYCSRSWYLIQTWFPFFSGTTNLFGRRRPQSCRTFSTICGRIKTLFQWTIVMTSHSRYVFSLQLPTSFLIFGSTDCTFCYRSCRYMSISFCIFHLLTYFSKDSGKAFRGKRKIRSFLMAIRWLTRRLYTSLPTISLLSCWCLVGRWAWRPGYGMSRLGLKNCGCVAKNNNIHACSFLR